MLAVGPVAVVSLMTAAAVAEHAAAGTYAYWQVAITLAFLSGGMLLIMGLLRLGFLANFLSHPVISGFIKKPKSDIVLFNDYTGSKNYYQNFYANKLIALGAPYNNYDIVTSPIDEMPNDNFTSIKVFNFFKKIIWFSNNANATLSLASQNTTNFFNNGGKMLMIVDIGGSFAYNESQVSFTPIASFVSPPTVNDQFKMNPGDTATAVQSGWPNLITSSGILSTSIRPFFLQNTSANFAYSNLYNGKLVIPASPAPITWTGQSALIARRKDIATGATNLIFSAIPFDLLQGNSNIDTVFRKIIIEELKF